MSFIPKSSDKQCCCNCFHTRQFHRSTIIDWIGSNKIRNYKFKTIIKIKSLRNSIQYYVNVENFLSIYEMALLRFYSKNNQQHKHHVVLQFLYQQEKQLVFQKDFIETQRKIKNQKKSKQILNSKK